MSFLTRIDREVSLFTVQGNLLSANNIQRRTGNFHTPPATHTSGLRPADNSTENALHSRTRGAHVRLPVGAAVEPVLELVVEVGTPRPVVGVHQLRLGHLPRRRTLATTRHDVTSRDQNQSTTSTSQQSLAMFHCTQSYSRTPLFALAIFHGDSSTLICHYRILIASLLTPLLQFIASTSLE